MASSPITSWQRDGETMGLVTNYFSDSKITVDGECNETKRHLLLGRKALANLDSILKSRDITLPTKVCLVNAMVNAWHAAVSGFTKSWTQLSD